MASEKTEKDKKKLNLADALADVSIDTEGLLPNQTPIRDESLSKGGRKTSRFKDTVLNEEIDWEAWEAAPDDRKNFYYVKNEESKRRAIKTQFQRYFENPEKYGMTEDSTVKDAVKTFDTQAPENKLNLLEKMGIDVNTTIKKAKEIFDLSKLNPFAARVANAAGIDEEFDPEGDGYDYKSAISAGIKPELAEDGKLHWPSRNPKTGQLLKGKKHETWDLLEKGEKEAGMEIYQKDDGKYYSKEKGKKTTSLKEMFDKYGDDPVELQMQKMVAVGDKHLAEGGEIRKTPVLDAVMDTLSGGMSLENFAELEEKEKAAYSHLIPNIPKIASAIGKTNTFNIISKIKQNKNIYTDEEKYAVLEQLNTLTKPFGRVISPLKEATHAMLDKKPEEVMKRMVKGFLSPEETDTLISRIPMEEWELEGSVARLIPRAIGEAIEQVAYARLAFGRPIKSAMERINYSHYSKVRGNIEKLVPKLEEAGKVKFPPNMSISDKANTIIRAAETDPSVGKFINEVINRTPIFRNIAKGEMGEMKFIHEASPFKSNAMAAANYKLPAAVNGVQALQTLLKSGLSPEEIEFSGVEEFLKSKKKFTRDEIVEYLDKNKVKVEPIIKGGKKVYPQGVLDATRENMEELLGRPVTDQELEEYVQEESGTEAQISGAKYNSYQLPGGEAYQETLLTKPFSGASGVVKGKDLKAGQTILIYDEPAVIEDIIYDEDTGKPSEVLFSDGQTMEIDLKGKYELEDTTGSTYQSSHWDEPNVLVHHRTNQRTDAKGNKGTFVEEIQSDWHREGKSKGYKTDLSQSEKETLRELNKELSKIENKQIENDRELRYLNHLVGAGKEQKKDLARRTKLQESLREEFRNVNTDIQSYSTEGVPNAPFKKTWHELALKDIIRQAIERGDKFVAFISGEQTADRYDLSKQIDRINYLKVDEDTYKIQVHPKGQSSIEKVLKKDEISNFVGKDIADKIINDKGFIGKNKDRYATIDNPGLKVGGEWAKKFYDEILPRAAQKYIKKWGGKVEDINIGDSIELVDDGEGAREIITEGTQKGFYITPQMVKEVQLIGQPLFGNRLAGGIQKLSESRGMAGTASSEPLPDNMPEKPLILDAIESAKPKPKASAKRSEVSKETVSGWDKISFPAIDAKLVALKAERFKIYTGSYNGKKTIKELNKEISALKKEKIELIKKADIAFKTKPDGKKIPAIRKSGIYAEKEFEVDEFRDAGGLSDNLTSWAATADNVQEGKGFGAAYKLIADPVYKSIADRNDFISLQTARIIDLAKKHKISTSSAKDGQIITALLEGQEVKAKVGHKAFAKDFRQIYDELRISANEVRRQLGKPEIGYLENYVSHIKRTAAFQDLIKQVQTSISENFDFIVPNEKRNPHAMRRTGEMADREMNFWKIIDKYIGAISSDIYISPTIEKLKAVGSVFEGREMYKSKKFLDNYIRGNLLKKPDAFDNAIGLREGSPLRKIASSITRARQLGALAGNISWTFLTQPMSLANTIMKTGLKNSITGGLRWFLPSVRRASHKLNVMRLKRGVGVVSSGSGDLDRMAAKVYSGKVDTFNTILGKFGDFVEYNVTGMSIEAGRAMGKQYGLKGKDLDLYADYIGQVTQSVYNPEARTQMLNSLALRTGFPFQSFAFELNRHFKTIFGKSGGLPLDAKQRLFHIINMMIAMGIAKAMNKKFRSREMSVGSFIPLVGGFVDEMVAKAYNAMAKKAGRKGIRVYGRAPLAPMEDVRKFGKAIGDIVLRGNYNRMRKELVFWLPSFFGIGGGGQANKTIDGLLASEKGFVEDVNGRRIFKLYDWDRVWAPIAGPWGTKAGREYLEGTKKKRFNPNALRAAARARKAKFRKKFKRLK